MTTPLDIDLTEKRIELLRPYKPRYVVTRPPAMLITMDTVTAFEPAIPGGLGDDPDTPLPPLRDKNQPPEPCPVEYRDGLKPWKAPNGDVYRFKLEPGKLGGGRWILTGSDKRR